MHRQARLLPWPAARGERAALIGRGRPCVWLVEEGASPPANWSDFEDWVRLPADKRDIDARAAGVEARARALTPSAWIDEFDVVWNGDAWVALSPLQARVMRCLLERERKVVRREDLVAAAWPEGEGEDKADINTPIKLLRRKSTPIGIMIHTIASRGYLVEVTEVATRQEVANSTP